MPSRSARRRCARHRSPRSSARSAFARPVHGPCDYVPFVRSLRLPRRAGDAPDDDATRSSGCRPGTRRATAEPPFDTNYQTVIDQYFTDLGRGESERSAQRLRRRRRTYYDNARPGDSITTNQTYGGIVRPTRHGVPGERLHRSDSATTAHCLTDAQLADRDRPRDHRVNGWPTSATHMFFIFTPRGCRELLRLGPTAAPIPATARTTPTTAPAAARVDLREPAVSELQRRSVRRVTATPAAPERRRRRRHVLSVASHEHNEAITDPEVRHRLVGRRRPHGRRERGQVRLVLRRRSRARAARSTTRRSTATTTTSSSSGATTAARVWRRTRSDTALPSSSRRTAATGRRSRSRAPTSAGPPRSSSTA